jgi:hypothetical protein
VATYNTGIIVENADNQGGIEGFLEISLVGGQFAPATLKEGPDNHFLAQGVPAGLTAKLTRISESKAHLSFLGSADYHNQGNDTEVTITLLPKSNTIGAAYAGGAITKIKLDFSDPNINPCEPGGSLSSTCVISSPYTIQSSTTLTASGKIILANGGALVGSGAGLIGLRIAGDLHALEGSRIEGNFANIRVGGALKMDFGSQFIGNIEDSAIGSMDVESGAVISADGKGHGSAYQPSLYPKNYVAPNKFLLGGFFGGQGGGFYDQDDSDCYGDAMIPREPVTIADIKPFDPNDPNEYGVAGRWGTNVNPGGGKLRINVATSLVINGTITADGVHVVDGGGGAGGLIRLQAETIAGNGLLQANGATAKKTGYYGCGWYYAGSGGGGSIVALANVLNFGGTTSVAGGARNAPDYLVIKYDPILKATLNRTKEQIDAADVTAGKPGTVLFGPKSPEDL